MKLINKKTGGLANCEPIEVKTDAGFHDYYSLAELNQDWEDYAPSEPLIKDEKIRKAIRAWAEANVINPERYYNTNIRFNATEHRLQWIQTAIEFNDIMGLDNLEDGKTYTIEELCGDDEE